jgi:transcriptional regulator with XRE-family HTH domain
MGITPRIGEQIRSYREWRGLSLKSLCVRLGIAPSYLSRLENGHMVPSVITLQKIVGALRIPLAALLQDCEESSIVNPGPNNFGQTAGGWGVSPKEVRLLERFCAFFSRMKDRDLDVLLDVAQVLAKENRHKAMHKRTREKGTTQKTRTSSHVGASRKVGTC